MPSQTPNSYDAPHDGNRRISEPSYNSPWTADVAESQPPGPTLFPGYIPPQTPTLHSPFRFPTKPQQETAEVNSFTFHGHGAPLYAGPLSTPNQHYAFSGPDPIGITTPTANFSSSSSPFTPVNAMIGTDETDETETTSPFEMHYGDQLSALFPGGRPVEPRRDSLANSEEAETSPGTRTRIFRGRRRSEYVEPGSARAIYLEKNRKAAAKCRSKQKMEQDALVEESRRAERLNRHLRAEEAMVRAEVHHLREQLAQHVNCPDQRIAQYLQQEADRLAGRGMGPPHQ